MKKLTVLILAFCILQSGVLAAPDAVPVGAKASVVIEAKSGRVLCEHNARQKMGMASTTKIMTAIIALENSKPDDIVTVDKRAEGVEGSSLYLKAGDKISMRDLLYGMLLRSGNDAATAVALHFCPTVEDFAGLMNEKAKSLGLCDTQFKNPHGLFEEGHYTTAYDLAMITRYGYTLDGFADMVSSKSYAIKSNIESKFVSNNNKLLRFYEGADGVKTGYTPETGRTLVGSAVREGMRVIAVTLDDGQDWDDQMAMFDYAFENYEYKTFVCKNQSFGCASVKGGAMPDVPICAEDDITAASRKNAEITVKADTVPITAPVFKGEKIGVVCVYEDGEEIGKTNLVAGLGTEKAKKESLFKKIINWIMGK